MGRSRRTLFLIGQEQDVDVLRRAREPPGCLVLCLVCLEDKALCEKEKGGLALSSGSRGGATR
jgi:hypothetical protein